MQFNGFTSLILLTFFFCEIENFLKTFFDVMFASKIIIENENEQSRRASVIKFIQVNRLNDSIYGNFTFIFPSKQFNCPQLLQTINI